MFEMVQHRFYLSFKNTQIFELFGVLIPWGVSHTPRPPGLSLRELIELAR